MKIAVDLDNTIDANPKEFQSLMSALQAAGHRVIVLTGNSNDSAIEQDWNDKCKYLTGLGCSSCWDQLTVLAHTNAGNISDEKAKWCTDNGVDILIDNSKENAKAATKAGIPLVLVPWATRS